MIEWWNSLGGLNQGFYLAAGFFSLIFLWQFISSIIGLSTEGLDVEVDADIDADAGMDLDDIEAHSLEEAGETMVAFRVFSLRAILAFCTLFSWAGALYLPRTESLSTTLLYALGWGLLGWLVVSLLVWWLRGLAETGTRKLTTCVGKAGTVYLDIPADGLGEVRVAVSGAISMVKARAAGGAALKAGTPVRVGRILNETTVEVRSVDADRNDNEGNES